MLDFVSYKINQLAFSNTDDVKAAVNNSGYSLGEIEIKTSYTDDKKSLLVEILLDGMAYMIDAIPVSSILEYTNETVVKNTLENKIISILQANPKIIYNPRVDDNIDNFGLF